MNKLLSVDTVRCSILEFLQNGMKDPMCGMEGTSWFYKRGVFYNSLTDHYWGAEHILVELEEVNPGYYPIRKLVSMGYTRLNFDGAILYVDGIDSDVFVRVAKMLGLEYYQEVDGSEN